MWCLIHYWSKWSTPGDKYNCSSTQWKECSNCKRVKVRWIG